MGPRALRKGRDLAQNGLSGTLDDEIGQWIKGVELELVYHVIQCADINIGTGRHFHTGEYGAQDIHSGFSDQGCGHHRGL